MDRIGVITHIPAASQWLPALLEALQSHELPVREHRAESLAGLSGLICLTHARDERLADYAAQSAGLRRGVLLVQPYGDRVWIGPSWRGVQAPCFACWERYCELFPQVFPHQAKAPEAPLIAALANVLAGWATSGAQPSSGTFIELRVHSLREWRLVHDPVCLTCGSCAERSLPAYVFTGATVV